MSNNVHNGQNAINRNGKALSDKQALLLSLITAFFSLAIPSSLSATLTLTADAISWGVCLAFGILVLMNTRKFSTIIIVGLALTFFYSLMGSVTMLALVVGAVSACGAYSALASSVRKWQTALLLLTPAIAFSATYLITLDWILAASAILPLIPALGMGIALRIQKNRVSAIACFATIGLAEILAAFVLCVYLINGHFSLELVNESAAYFRVVTEDILKLAIETSGEVSLSEDIVIMIEALAIEMTNLLVGTIAVAVITFGFFAQKIQYVFLSRFEVTDLAESGNAPIKASVFAALVYLAAYICSFTSSPSSMPSFFAAASRNLGLVLLPLLLCVGFTFLKSIPRKIGFFSILAWLGVVGVAYLLQSSVVDIIALVGAFYTIIVNIDLWAETHYSKGGDQ